MSVSVPDTLFLCGVGKRGIINAAPATGNIWAQPTGNDPSDPFGEAWDREDTPEADWATYTSGPTDSQDDYHSPAASFLASQEFEDHPNNPEGRRVFSNDDFQVEADINQDGAVNFLDISPFIGLLSGV